MTQHPAIDIDALRGVAGSVVTPWLGKTDLQTRFKRPMPVDSVTARAAVHATKTNTLM